MSGFVLSPSQGQRCCPSLDGWALPADGVGVAMSLLFSCRDKSGNNGLGPVVTVLGAKSPFQARKPPAQRRAELDARLLQAQFRPLKRCQQFTRRAFDAVFQQRVKTLFGMPMWAATRLPKGRPDPGPLCNQKKTTTPTRPSKPTRAGKNIRYPPFLKMRSQYEPKSRRCIVL